MQKNIGTQEAYARIGAGVAVLLLALFITENPTIRIILAVLAAILAGTAFLRTCPINTLLKRNTYSEVDASRETMSEEVEQPQEKVAEPASTDAPMEENPMGSGMPIGGTQETVPDTTEEKQ